MFNLNPIEKLKEAIANRDYETYLLALDELPATISPCSGYKIYSDAEAVILTDKIENLSLILWRNGEIEIMEEHKSKLIPDIQLAGILSWHMNDNKASYELCGRIISSPKKLAISHILTFLSKFEEACLS